MLSLRNVSKIRIITTEQHKGLLIRSLYSLGLVQVVSAKNADQDKPLAEYAQISEALVSLRSIAKKYGIKPSPKAKSRSPDFEKAMEEYARLKESLSQSEGRVAEKNAELSDRKAFARLCQEFESQGGKLGDRIPWHAASIDLAFFQPADRTSVGKVAAAQQGSKLEIIVNRRRQPESAAPVAAIFDSSKGSEIMASFEANGKVLAGPARVSKEKSFIDLAGEAAGTVSQSEGELSKAEKEYAEALSRHGAKFFGVLGHLETLSKLATLPLKFGKTKSLVIVEAWVPSDLYASIQSRLDDDLGKVVHVEKLETLDEPPTMFKNPGFAKPYETLVGFFSLPKAELDPTLLISVSFPLFFGLILCDIGYGLVGLLLALWLGASFGSNRFARDLGHVLLLSSVSSVFFGFVFAEFFGKADILGLRLVPVIHRVAGEGTNTMIAISLVLGVIHLVLGYALGIANALSHHDAGHALAKCAWLALLLGGIALYFAKTAPPASELVGIPAGTVDAAASIAVAVSLLAILKLEGIAGGIEVFGLVSNVFSYLRIMALGLSGAILATVINQLPVDFDALVGMASGARPFDPGAIATFLVFLAMLAVGHALAFALGLLESGVQSLRLHYVEFFSKFYRGGGVEFVPLRGENE